jgi:DNA repair exonuclease SbcCD ATPase subunit
MPRVGNAVDAVQQAQPSDDVAALSVRVTKHTATLMQQDRTIRQMQLHGKEEKEDFLREIHNLKEELKVKDEQIETLTEATRELQQRLSANENLFARVSAIEAELGDRTWQEKVETNLQKLGASVRLVSDAAHTSVDQLKQAVHDAFAKVQSRLNRIEYDVEMTSGGLVELDKAFTSANATRVASERPVE